jgi:RNA polymerase sigma-70 factor (ECF subfamily)
MATPSSLGANLGARSITNRDQSDRQLTSHGVGDSVTTVRLCATGLQMTDDDGVTDESLLVAARSDGEAFARFYRRHAPVLLGYLVRRTRDPELGADLTAETFACALEGVARFDPARGSATGWLFGIARHQLARALERGRVDRRARDRLGMSRIQLDDGALERIEALAAAETTAARITGALEKLPSEQRAAFTARVVEHQNYAAIASAAGTSEATVRKRVSRALHGLRDALGGQQ